MSRNLIARLAVAAVFIPIILYICVQGGDVLLGMLMVFALLAIGEFLWAEGFRPGNVGFWAGLLFVATVLGRFFVPDQTLLASTPTSSVGLLLESSLVFVGLFLITGGILALGKRPAADLFRRHSRLMWGMAYVGFLYSFVYLLDGPAEGGDLFFFLFGLLWVGDTAAMAVGKMLGKHRLAPTVSPNKTVEGFVGGLFGAACIGVLMYFWMFPQYGLLHTLVLAVGCSLFGQVGDLVESMWKRSLDIKDSSAIIPGHGGVLDRFDSLLFAAPFMYFYISVTNL